MPSHAELEALIGLPVPYPGSEDCLVCAGTGWLEWAIIAPVEESDLPVPGPAERVTLNSDPDDVVPCGACQESSPDMEWALPNPLAHMPSR
ncbi:hypothetical protein SAMN05216298_0327 [Glycomyces sambucus]|uniref:Uncharacterized protein n=2 Tax=Glycomyces sambucus TaxID=380244 RepID=A0A1G9CGS5_9ACTN|nr:hypothetical protein SAMN05216298_0327 [Glycomyces sambucus]